MRLHYKGPHQWVSIPLPNGREVEVAKGHDVDLSDHLTKADANALGRSLLEQGESWSEPAEAKKPDAKSAEKED